jgi:hypothetical protein
MKQMKLMDEPKSTDDVVTFYLDFKRLLNLAASRGEQLTRVLLLAEGIAIWWVRESDRMPMNGGTHPTLHTAIKAEIARMEKPAELEKGGE